MRSHAESNLDLVLPVVREAIVHQVREVFLQGKVGGLDNGSRKLVVAAKLLQRLDDLLFFARLIFEDDLQGRAGSQTFSTSASRNPEVASTASTSGEGRVAKSTR